MTPLAAVRASRGTVRLFLVAAAGEVGARVTGRLTRLHRSPWSGELEVSWVQNNS